MSVWEQIGLLGVAEGLLVLPVGSFRLAAQRGFELELVLVLWISTDSAMERAGCSICSALSMS